MDLAGWSRTKGGTTTEAGHRLAPDGCDPLGVANLAANSVLLTELATEVDGHDAPDPDIHPLEVSVGNGRNMCGLNSHRVET